MNRFASIGCRNTSSAVYDMLGPTGQACLDRFRYAAGLLPRVAPELPRTAVQRVSPAGCRAALIISADLELAWGWRYVRGKRDPVDYALSRAARARRNFGPLLALFELYDIPVTWAVVGHLLLEKCGRRNGVAHAEIKRIPHFENEHWHYRAGDWFDADPCSSWQRDPAWYAPDLIQEVRQGKVHHEIACHSFSHVDFSDQLCPPEAADSDLRECQKVALEQDLTLQSFVFPGNQVGNLASLKRHGFVAYRWHSGHELDVPRRDGLGLWRIPGGISWEKPGRWPVDAWIRALKRCVDGAIETKTLLHLWFHPSCDPINLQVVFPSLVQYISSRQADLWATTMAGLVAWLTSDGE